MNIGIIGCGYVGMVTGVCLAELGHTVTAVDNDPEKLAMLQNLQCPIYEPGLEQLFNTYVREKRLTFSGSIAQAVRDSQIIFICVNTPSNPDGSADLSFVESVAKEIAVNLREYRLIVEKSTVPVQTGEWVRRTISRNAPPNVEFDVASNPEFLREGTAIDDFLHPDRVVIGADSRRASSLLTELYAPLNAPILLTDINSAELIKHSANAFLALKISFINSVAQICSRSGADIKKVAKGIGLDRRIGSNAMEAGIGYGGMCLPKDVAAYIRIAKELGYDFEILKAVQNVNNKQRLWPLEILKHRFSSLQGLTIAIWGLSFKPNTDDLRYAPSLEITAALLKEKVKVRCFDPVAMKKAALQIPEAKMCPNAYEACYKADALIICTEWPEFKTLDLHKVAENMKLPVIIDGRNILEPSRMAAHGFEYFSVGRQ
ncbi:UDP-glucose/GDP-mannose dehydrogenase family protein [bacterium]|nr:UDP-glucose/GDP-mannose dehydrogenase family protein [bacterium]